MYEALIVIVLQTKNKKKYKIRKKIKHSHNNLQGHELWQVDLLSNVNNIYSYTRKSILIVIANILWLIEKCLHLLKAQ